MSRKSMDSIFSGASKILRRGASDKTMDDLSAFMEGMTVFSSLDSDKKLSLFNSNMSLESSQMLIQLEATVNGHSSLAGDLTLTDKDTATAMMLEQAELSSLNPQKGSYKQNWDSYSWSERRSRSDASLSRKPVHLADVLDSCDGDIRMGQEAALPPFSSSASTYKSPSITAPMFYEDIRLNSPKALDPRSDLKPPPFALTSTCFEDINLEGIENDDALANVAIDWRSSRSGGLKLDLSETLPVVIECTTTQAGSQRTPLNESKLPDEVPSMVGLNAPISTPRSFPLTSLDHIDAPLVTPDSQPRQPNESLKIVDPVAMEDISIPKEPLSGSKAAMVESVDVCSVGGRVVGSPKAFFSPTDNEDDRIYVAKKDVTDHDVLCGREIAGTDHPGNLLYYRLVEANKEAYQATSDRGIKAGIKNRIVEQVTQKGRFINESKDRRVYYLLTKKRVSEKVGKSLGAKKKAKKT